MKKGNRAKQPNCAKNSKAAVHVPDYANSRALSLWGTMEILEDRDSKQAAWLEGFERYYPEGIDTPWLCMLRFTALCGQYYRGRP
jgi:general stress protein 26